MCCISGLRNASRRFELAGLKVGVVMVVALCEPECWSNGAQPMYLQAHPEWDGESEKPANKSDLTSDLKEISWTVLCNSFRLKTGDRAGGEDLQWTTAPSLQKI